MATASQSKKQRNGIADVPRRVGRTVEATVTEPPNRAETALDVALIGAAVLELLSPPLALAGIALNRIVHVAK